MDADTEIRSSVQTHPPAIYTGQSFSNLFCIFVTFQVILSQNLQRFGFLVAIFPKCAFDPLPPQVKIANLPELLMSSLRDIFFFFSRPTAN